MDYGRRELADRLSADYVAGTLRGAARRRFESLLAAHPALRESVAAWQLRLMPLTQTVAPVQPPARVWQRIEARIGGAAATAGAAVSPAPAGWWQRLALWRGLAALATIVAIGFALLLQQPAPTQPPLVVVLAPAEGANAAQGGFVAGVSADGRSVVTRPIAPVALQADKSLELWAVPPKGSPRSMGVISEKQATVVQPDRLPPGTVALAVSLEPPGGSPTGTATGPILFVGKLAP